MQVKTVRPTWQYTSKSNKFATLTFGTSQLLGFGVEFLNCQKLIIMFQSLE